MAFQPIYAIRDRHRRGTLLPYKQGIDDGSTLTLDFTKGQLDPRLTFTRGTNATFINSSGLVELAAANFITQSNNFAVSPWSSLNVTMSIDGSSPVGDAWKMLENNVSSLHRLDLASVSYGNNGLSMTVSVYVKQGSGSRHAYFTVSDNATGDIRSKRLNPVTGLLEGSESVGGSWTNVSTSVQSVGDGWYRLVFTATKNAGAAVICRTGMCDSSGNLSYAGDGTSFLYFAGCQINPGTSAQAYNATTGSAYTAPRFDYDPSSIGTPRGLLIESSATNLSEQGQYCWGSGTTISWSRSAGINVNAVNGTSGANAVQRIDGPDGGSLTGTSIFKDSGTTFVRLQYVDFAVQANTTYTWSAYVRAPSGGNPYIRLGAFNGGTWLNTTGGCTLSSVTITNSAGFGSQFNGVPSGSWVRVWVTFTTQAAQTLASIGFYPDANTTNAATMYVWGSQVETGSGPSSVIPTGASQGSRAADNCELLDLTTMGFNANTGTIYTDVGTRLNTGSQRNYTFLPASGSNNQIFEGSGVALNVYTSGSFVAQIGSSGLSASKIAAAYATGDYAVSVNGGAVATDSAGAVPTSLTKLTIGGSIVNATAYANGCIRVFKYWPTRLPNAQLQSLTT